MDRHGRCALDLDECARQSVGHDLGAHAATAFGLLERFRVNTV